MEVLNIWTLLTSIETVGNFGIPIYWLPVLIGEMVVPAPIRTGEFNLGGVMEVYTSRGVVLSLPIWLTSLGVRKTRAPLHAASVTITFKVGGWHACVVPLPAATPSGICGSIGSMMIEMVWLINIYIYIFLVLVVSVSVTFLFFQWLVWVATNGSIFGLPYTSLTMDIFCQFPVKINT